MMADKKVTMADFASMLDARLASYHTGFNPGDRVDGTVDNITNQFVVLDVTPSAKEPSPSPT